MAKLLNRFGYWTARWHPDRIQSFCHWFTTSLYLEEFSMDAAYLASLGRRFLANGRIPLVYMRTVDGSSSVAARGKIEWRNCIAASFIQQYENKTEKFSNREIRNI